MEECCLCNIFGRTLQLPGLCTMKRLAERHVVCVCSFSCLQLEQRWQSLPLLCACGGAPPLQPTWWISTALDRPQGQPHAPLT